jgi:hypothetical protein
VPKEIANNEANDHYLHPVTVLQVPTPPNIDDNLHKKNEHVFGDKGQVSAQPIRTVYKKY